MNSPKTGILLMNLGGPDCIESVKPFLFNLFADPDIIKLPLSIVFQKPLAWAISSFRAKNSEANYAMMGGSSPILQFTQQQGELLKAELQNKGYGELSIYIAMRYWHPMTEEAVDAMIKDGIERLIVLPLYPHFSYTSTGSSLNELKRVLELKNVQLDIGVVPPYFNHPLYLKAMAETIQEGLESHAWSCPKEEVQVIFSAHSLPVQHVKKTKDPYPEQIYTCAESIMKTYFPNNPWELAYQSRVGKTAWLGPSVDGVLHYFAGKKQNNLLLLAISFVSDHVETLVEIDHEYIGLATELQIEHCYRAPALNTRASFIQALVELTAKELDQKQGLPLTINTFPELFQAQVSS